MQSCATQAGCGGAPGPSMLPAAVVRSKQASLQASVILATKLICCLFAWKTVSRGVLDSYLRTTTGYFRGGRGSGKGVRRVFPSARRAGRPAGTAMALDLEIYNKT